MTHHKGLHHISVLAGNPTQNAQFYIKKLGMRLVKKSVNQDDPNTYHLFYGNEAANPGSSITFFPWPRAHRGTTGTGEAVNVAFQVPLGSESFWMYRLSELGIEHKVLSIFGKEAVRFKDPDGLELDLIFDGNAKEKISTFESSVPVEQAVQGFWSTRLKLTQAEGTSDILTNILGFDEQKTEGNLTLLSSEGNIGTHVIIEESETEEQGHGGRGIVHHVAFRAKDMDDLKNMREQVLERGLQPTEVIDRHWFNSVYFREPSGILFELATDGPGYATDEDFNHLGEKLILTPWLEPRRNLIERTLPNLEL